MANRKDNARLAAVGAHIIERAAAKNPVKSLDDLVTDLVAAKNGLAAIKNGKGEYKLINGKRVDAKTVFVNSLRNIVRANDPKRLDKPHAGARAIALRLCQQFEIPVSVESTDATMPEVSALDAAFDMEAEAEE